MGNSDRNRVSVVRNDTPSSKICFRSVQDAFLPNCFKQHYRFAFNRETRWTFRRQLAYIHVIIFIATYNDIHLMIAIHRTARSKYKLFSSNKFVLLRSVSLSVNDRRNKIKVNIFDNIGSSFYIDFIFSVTISDDLI